MRYPFFKQQDLMDCAPTCLRMICSYYGYNKSQVFFTNLCEVDREGTSFLMLSNAAEKVGFKTLSVYLKEKGFDDKLPTPFIVLLKKNHFLVVYKITQKSVLVADPNAGLYKISRKLFFERWGFEDVEKNGLQGIALLLEPTSEFYNRKSDGKSQSVSNLVFVYLKKHRKSFAQLAIGLLVTILLTFAFPFLTQSVVDVGIRTGDINYINLILLSQFVLFASSTINTIFQSWVLFHVGARIGISLTSEFLIKVLKLPVSYFDRKLNGDILQRLGDNGRIQAFITTSLLQICYAAISLSVFGVVLVVYSYKIALIYLIGSTLYFTWILLFLKQRKKLDYELFDSSSRSQSSIIQLVSAIKEIKILNAEKTKRWEWERLQAKQFKLSIRSKILQQTQSVGSSIIDQIKSLFISYYAARLVIDGEITLGMMLSIQFIIGQLNTPISQIINFVTSFQDARISFDRINEVLSIDEVKQSNFNTDFKTLKFDALYDINIKDLSFNYPNGGTALKNISLEIPKGKFVAIVGESGSGKSTVLKLLQQSYNPIDGQIVIGPYNLNLIDEYKWRNQIGTVTNDGFIFSDTIARNIAINDEIIDTQKLMESIELSCLSEYYSQLPLSYNTFIGESGLGVSHGQQQRLMFARLFYKNPDYIFLDEATNALDFLTEEKILNNIFKKFAGKTIVMVAHRLSTVKNADIIYVFNKGMVAEFGNFENLMTNDGYFAKLMHSQIINK